MQCLAISADQRWLASAGGFDRSIRLWSLQRPETPPVVLQDSRDAVLRVAFDSRGRLFSVGYAGELAMHEGRDWQTRRSLKSAIPIVRSLAVSADGRRLAVGGTHHDVEIWDLLTLKMERTISGHRQYAYALGFSPDSKELAIGDAEGNIAIWRF